MCKPMQQVMALPGRNWPNCQSLLSISSEWGLLKMSGMVMSNSPWYLHLPGCDTPHFELVTIQGVCGDKSKQREGALLDSRLSPFLSTRVSDSRHSHLSLRASLFPEQRRCRKQGQTWHAAAWHPLVFWEIIPLADWTHEWTPNNSSQAAWPALATHLSFRWCRELSQLCHSGPRVSASQSFSWWCTVLSLKHPLLPQKDKTDMAGESEDRMMYKWATSWHRLHSLYLSKHKRLVLLRPV